MSTPKAWFGRLATVRRIWAPSTSEFNGYYLVGELTEEGTRYGRQVELLVTQERLQGMVINLTAEGGLFPSTSVGRLRLLVHLGVPEADARRIANVPTPESA